MDNKDLLNYYTVDESENGKIEIVDSSGYNKLNASYPNNCIDVKWKSNHTYVVNYGLKDKKYVHEFFIGSNRNVSFTVVFWYFDDCYKRQGKYDRQCFKELHTLKKNLLSHIYPIPVRLYSVSPLSFPLFVAIYCY